METIKEQIEVKADKLVKEFKGKYGTGSNIRAEDVANWIKETYIESSIETLKLANEWHNSNEYPPKNGWYLCKIPSHIVPIICYCDIDEFRWDKEITHWKHITLE